MPRKRYYCEYCDKSFSDNQTNRRNHLNGIQHKTIVTNHYNTFKEPEIILAEESVKKPCRTFLQTGECKFASYCKYSHLTQPERENLVQLVKEKETRINAENSELIIAASLDPILILNNWIENRKIQSADKNKNIDAIAIEQQEKAQDDTNLELLNEKLSENIYKLPSVLIGYPHLPISLLPYKANNNAHNITSWG